MAVDGAFDDVAQTPGLDYVLHSRCLLVRPSVYRVLHTNTRENSCVAVPFQLVRCQERITGSRHQRHNVHP